jgi:mRNA-degrading endonuclease RelE of RelBE toxin-antitoxin system
METATIRIPEDKRNLLKAISSLEKRKMNDIIFTRTSDRWRENSRDFFRLRVGDYLVIFELDQQNKRIGILAICSLINPAAIIY